MLWFPDLRTILFYSAALSLLVGAVLCIAWYRLPRELRPALRWWLAGLFLYPSSYVLIGLRDQIPDWLSIVAASGFLAIGMTCTAIALRQFCGVPERRLRLWVTSALVVVAVSWFTFVAPDLHWRQVVTSVLFAILIGSSARAILRRDGPDSAIARLTGGLFVIGTAIMVFRGVYELAIPTPASGLFAVGLPLVLCFATLGMLPTLSTVGFLLMCTERSQLALESAARHDHLTGIFNRRALEDLAHQAMASARRHGTPLAILIVDVDHFKRINDELGHHSGDLALVETVQRIRTGLRAEDLVGRLGGEEFVLVLPNTDGGSALATAERVREAFDGQPIHGGDTAIAVTVSIGVTTLAAGDSEFAHLLRRADRAMYAAKAAGRNCVMADAAALSSG